MAQKRSAKRYSTQAGTRYPPGASVRPDGVNFAILSRHATAAELLLYARADSASPFQVVALDPRIHRTFFFWHVFVEGLAPGVHYTWRFQGPFDPPRGLSFEPRREIVDPWARAVTDALWDRPLASTAEGAGRSSMRSVVVQTARSARDAAPAQPREDSVIYELHVRGFTRHPSSGVRHPGTFLGLIEKIPYLQALGVTHVELMPVMAFDAQDVPPAAVARGLCNYWGYSPHSFFSPHPGFCLEPQAGGHVREFREMVRALHRAGIGVILDVVFNHTAEGGAGGPAINFKGMGAPLFYHTEPWDRSRFRDYTGCGNTIDCSHPVVVDFLVDCLDYWAAQMRVDGFRFDLASVFARGEDGSPLANPRLPWAIELSDRLADKWLIAEAWDAAGLYHVGAFPGMGWAEWNGRYRDSIRRFVRGDPGLAGEVATRIAGSSDLYQDDGRLPGNSINFVTCHDGFTLHDLVSYERKHNQANGEDNRDGTDDNLSWNCGVEGETDAAHILALRRRQAKNIMAILLLSQGVPMLLAGDEVLRTQGGNNNAYCQDNDTSWFDWGLVERNREMLRFTREMIALRKRHPSLRRRLFLTGAPAAGDALPDIAWHGHRLDEPPWFDPGARLLAFTLAALAHGEEPLHAILNMSDDWLELPLPQLPGNLWHRAADTSQASPHDISPRGKQIKLTTHAYRAAPRSVVVLEARPL